MALGMLQQAGMLWPLGSQPLPGTHSQPPLVELHKAFMSQLQHQGHERLGMGIPSTTVSSGPPAQSRPT